MNYKCLFLLSKARGTCQAVISDRYAELKGVPLYRQTLQKLGESFAVFIMRALFSLQIRAWLVMLHVTVVLTFVRSSLRFHLPMKLKANWASTAFPQVPRFEVPSRYDTCKLLISGVVGTDPKEIYLKSGHYVVNFAVSPCTLLLFF